MDLSGVGGLLERSRHRRRRSGARAPERPGALRVAQSRPRHDRRVPRGGHHGRRVRLLPRQLDRAGRRRQLPRLRPQHVGDLQDRPRKRRRHLAARRQEERLRDGARNGIRLAARRASPRRDRSAHQPVRRRRRTAGAAALEGARARPRHEAACARRSTGSTSTTRRCWPTRSAARSSSRTATCWSAGAPRPGSPSTHTTARLVFDAHLPAGGQNYRVLKMPWHGRPTDRPGDRSTYDATATGWSTRAGTAPPRSTRGGSRRDRPAPRSPPSARPAGPGSRPSWPRRADARYAAVVALDAQGRPLGRSKTAKFG